jgi:hypothetical protein
VGWQLDLLDGAPWTRPADGRGLETPITVSAWALSQLSLFGSGPVTRRPPPGARCSEWPGTHAAIAVVDQARQELAAGVKRDLRRVEGSAVSADGDDDLLREEVRAPANFDGRGQGPPTRPAASPDALQRLSRTALGHRVGAVALASRAPRRQLLPVAARAAPARRAGVGGGGKRVAERRAPIPWWQPQAMSAAKTSR